jgi:hypothetical protein
MSEIIEQAEAKSEYPKKGTSGNGSDVGYSVEVRYTGSNNAVVIDGEIYTGKWRRFSPKQSPIGVPPHHRYSVWLDQCHLMSYPAAQAIRWWFHAIADFEFKNLCLETRLVKHAVKYSFSEEAISDHSPIGGEDRSASIPDWGKKA